MLQVSLRIACGQLTAGDEVAALQRFLAEEVFASQRHVTGLFGPPTAAALRRWQQERGVPPSGTFGDVSRLACLHQQVEDGTLNAAVRNDRGHSGRKAVLSWRRAVIDECGSTCIPLHVAAFIHKLVTEL